ncbi:unnamed protein product [Urochloa decumbens]|uniref:F-box domain-containing protein n=1 Tax=Urochloa decumbens TaxID=240449 RepID=A0ABC8YS86_9POAL
MDLILILQFLASCLPRITVTGDAALSAAAGDGGGDEDRISALPDELLCDVVSRLPVKDAVRTTALSHRWHRVWHSTPLVLHDAHVGLVDDEPARVAAIDRVFAGHPGPLHTVHLAMCFFHLYQRELAQWSRVLAAGSVRDLVLFRLPRNIDLDDLLGLPADILCCAELERLCLGFWRFPDTSDLPDGAGVFPHLRELGIIRSIMEDRDLDHMLASSPALEMLSLVAGCHLPKHIRLRSQSLRCAHFCMCKALEITVLDAPHLERLIICHLADTKASPSSIVPSVKILELMVNWGVFTEVQILASFLRCFPNIETLHLEYCMADKTTIECYTEFFDKLSPIECVDSHAKHVVLHEFRGHQSEVTFVKYLCQRATKLQKLTLVLPDEMPASSVSEIKDLLNVLAIPPWASKACRVLLLGPRFQCDWSFHRLSDLSFDDPFLPVHGDEIFSYIKAAEQGG